MKPIAFIALAIVAAGACAQAQPTQAPSSANAAGPNQPLPDYVPLVHPRTTGGVLAGPTPWHVALYSGADAQRGYRCDGALVAPDWVLAPAVCGRTGEPLKALVGSNALDASGGGSIEVDRIVRSADPSTGAAPTLLHLAHPSAVAPIHVIESDDAIAPGARLLTYYWVESSPPALSVAPLVSSACAVADGGACGRPASTGEPCSDGPGETVTVRVAGATGAPHVMLAAFTLEGADCRQGRPLSRLLPLAGYSAWINRVTQTR